MSELSGTGSRGASLLGLVQAGRSLGLEVEGYEADAVSLAKLDCPAILHVLIDGRLQHFVVCYGVVGDEFVIGDPAAGVYRLSAVGLQRIWASRILITLRRTDGFKSTREKSAAKRQWLMEAVARDRQVLVVAAVLGLVVAGFGLTIALFSKVLLDEILPERDGLKLAVGLVLVAFCLTAQNGLMAVRQIILVRQARAFNMRIIRRFVDALMRLPFRFYAMRQTGDLVARLNDAERLQRVVTFVAGDLMINVLLLGTGLLFVFANSALIGAWIVTGLGLLGCCAAAGHAPIVDGQRKVMAAHAENESCYVDSIESIEAIKVSNAEPVFSTAMRLTFGRMQDAIYRLGRIGVAYTFFAQMAGLFMILGTLGWGAHLVLMGSVGIGSLVALLQITNMLIPAAYGIALANMELQEASVAFDRMYQYSSLEPEYGPGVRPARPRGLHRLVARDVTFRFPGRPALLDSISFELRRGEMVLLLGDTGSGKSTLLRLLLRLYVPESGRIFVDGKDWFETPTPTWRSMAALVPQDIRVFRGTLMDNVTMGPVEREANIEELCHQLGLGELIRELPHGVRSIVGDGGIRLSGGQRRLLGLARALHREPGLLLLDEVASGLDSSAVTRTIDLLLRRKSEMAILAASHGPELHGISDRTYVLENGRMHQRVLEEK